VAERLTKLFKSFEFTEFFRSHKFGQIPNLTRYNHFIFNQKFEVKCRQNFLTETFEVFNVRPSCMEHIHPGFHEHIALKKPKGLDLKRKQQIFEQLHEHYPSERADSPFCAPNPAQKLTKADKLTPKISTAKEKDEKNDKILTSLTKKIRLRTRPPLDHKKSSKRRRV